MTFLFSLLLSLLLLSLFLLSRLFLSSFFSLFLISPFFLTVKKTNNKQQVWGTDHSSLWGTTRHLYKDGGLRVFFKGAGLTVVRDMAFGATYEFLRANLRDRTSSKFWADFTAAATATALSSPINYARRMKYITPAGETPPRAVPALIDLWRSAKPLQPRERAGFLCQRLSLGWGELRVGAGLAVGQFIFDYLQPTFRKNWG